MEAKKELEDLKKTYKEQNNFDIGNEFKKIISK